MTDNEIIKALECCSKITFSCDGCPLKHLKYSECYELVIRSTLDLINRQQAEIEQITEKFNCQQTVYADLSKIIKEQAKEIKTAKAEAVKEVIARAKEYFNPDISFEFRKWLDSLEKELVGETDV